MAHKPFLQKDDPAFKFGTRWESNDGAGHQALIIRIRQWGAGSWDWEVIYVDKHGVLHDKDAQPFQIRYHPA